MMAILCAALLASLVVQTPAWAAPSRTSVTIIINGMVRLATRFVGSWRRCGCSQMAPPSMCRQNRRGNWRRLCVRSTRQFIRDCMGRFFFGAGEAGFSSKAGILLHEISHFTLAGATRNPKIYGTEEAKMLATTNPNAARMNAENYEYFVESVALDL